MIRLRKSCAQVFNLMKIENRSVELPVKTLRNKLSVQTLRSKIPPEELCYYIYFSLLLGVRALGFVEGEPVYTAVFTISVLAFVLKIFLSKETFREYLITAVFIGISGAVYLVTGEKGLILHFIIMLGMKNVPVRRVMKLSLVITSIAFAGNVILSRTGIIREMYYFQDRGNGGDIRHAFGYPHPNTAQAWSVFLVMLLMYLTGRSFSKYLRAAIFSVLLELYMYLYTGSRTGFFVALFCIVLEGIVLLRGRIDRFGAFIAYLSYPMAAAASLAMPFLSNVPAVQRFLFANGTINFRIDMLIYRWQTLHGPHFFGARFDYTAQPYGIDNSYSYMLLNLGIAAFAVISILFIWYIHTMICGQHIEEFPLVLGLLIYGMTEPFLFNLSTRNLIFILAGKTLFESSKQNVMTEDSVFRENKDELDNTKQYYLSLLAFAAAAASVCLIYFCTVKKPSSVYMDTNLTEIGTEQDISPVFLTGDEVEELIKQGDIFIGYHDSETIMYEYKGVAPINEYRRHMMNYAVPAGIIAAMGMSILYRFRSKGIWGKSNSKSRGAEGPAQSEQTDCVK